jgi:hypothetical protein
VTGFDIDDAAIEQANETASRNAAMNAKYSCHDLDLQPDELVQALSINPGDVVIVDPPRAGLHAKAVTMLANVRFCRLHTPFHRFPLTVTFCIGAVGGVSKIGVCFLQSSDTST